MKIKIRHVTKSAYRYLQYAGFVSVKEFVFARQDEKKYLLIRFANDTSFQINSMEYTIIQLDDKGAEIKKTKQIKSGLLIKCGGEYTTPDGVIVEESCSDIKVEVENVTSGSVKYRFENGELEAEYLRILPPIVETASKKKAKSPYTALYVAEKKIYKSKKASWIAVMGYIFLIAAAAAPYVAWLIKANLI